MVNSKTQKVVASKDIKGSDLLASSKSSVSGKRNLLKTMLAGAGAYQIMPATWHKPIINSVIIPAHAQTSPTDQSPLEPPTTEPPTPEPTTYTIDCNSVTFSPTGVATCGQFPNYDFTLTVSGSVSTSDGSSAAGVVVIRVSHTDVTRSINPTASHEYTRTAGMLTVDASNQFSGSVTIARQEGTWLDTRTLHVGFEDPVHGAPIVCSDIETNCLVSDIRLKNAVQLLGLSSKGFKLYRFHYTTDVSEQTYVGVMAQDLIETHPQALVKDNRGYFAVNYSLLGLKMASYADWQQHGLESVESVH